jgi:hypothetical protein
MHQPGAAPSRTVSARAGDATPERPEISLHLTVTLTCVFSAFGLAAGMVVGLINGAPTATAPVLASGLALRPRRS